MKNTKKQKNVSKKGKFKPGSKRREKCLVTFDDKDREDYLTGFHKRKVERRKTALAEIRKKIKDEQIRVREERHKEYMRLLKERTDALQEAEDDLEDAITGKTESVQYDHPSHTVTVTTISELDLSGAHLLGPADNPVNGECKDEENGKRKEEETRAMPRKARDTIMNKKIRSLNASLSSFTCKKRKGKREGGSGRGRQADKKQSAAEGKKKAGKSTKWQRRRLTGKKVHHRV